MRNKFWVIGFLLCAKLLAWGSVGHRIIGQVAQDHLTEEARVWLRDQFGVVNLAWEANWADDIRSSQGVKKHLNWHYAHFPESFNKQGNIFQGLEQSRQDIMDPSLNKQQRLEALRWYVHLVGDIHQPFHVTSKKKKGANGCMVKFMTPSRVISVHSMWDSALIDHEKLSFSEWASWLEDIKPVLKDKRSAPVDWANESYQLSLELMPKGSGFCKSRRDERLSRKLMPFLSWDYIHRVKPVLRSRLYQAGLRLASEINSMARHG